MIKLDDIKTQNDLVGLLAWPYDFDIGESDQDVSWIKLDPELPFECLAGEGAGGVYLAVGESPIIEDRPILFVSSEGRSGKIAKNLEEFLSLVITIPYWLDLLKFSGNGKLDEMKKTDYFMAREYCDDYPDLPKAKSLIESRLEVKILPNAIEVLHSNVHATDCAVLASDGWRYESLFNRFVSSDNISWR